MDGMQCMTKEDTTIYSSDSSLCVCSQSWCIFGFYMYKYIYILVLLTHGSLTPFEVESKKHDILEVAQVFNSMGA